MTHVRTNVYINEAGVGPASLCSRSRRLHAQPADTSRAALAAAGERREHLVQLTSGISLKQVQ